LIRPVIDGISNHVSPKFKSGRHAYMLRAERARDPVDDAKPKGECGDQKKIVRTSDRAPRRTERHLRISSDVRRPKKSLLLLGWVG
jgi:hypothetical protein